MNLACLSSNRSSNSFYRFATSSLEAGVCDTYYT